MRSRIFFAVLLALFTLSITTSTNATINDIRTNALAVKEPSGNSLTIWMTVNASGSVPNSIKRIRVRAPDGTFFDTDLGFPIVYLAFERGFYLKVNESEFDGGEIPSGYYRIQFYDSSGSLLVKDYVEVKLLGFPQNVYPNPDGTSVVSTAPTFTWDPVPRAKRYRVRIGRCSGSNCLDYPYYFEFSTNNTSIKIPKWFLWSGQQYRFQLEAYDDYDDPQNKSSTGFYDFFTAP